MDLIVHICLPAVWEETERKGIYLGDTLESQGFIHCSKPGQVLQVANAFYGDQSELLLIWIDPHKLDSEFRWEAADSDVFPHIYGPLNLSAVLGKTVLRPLEDGEFDQLIFPDGITR